MRIPYPQIIQTLTPILLRTSMLPERATLIAQLFADASRDGTPSHGLNRFPSFLHAIELGSVLPNAPLTLLSAAAALERWDGNLGPGPWNAHQSMHRAITLAKTYGIGCVALRNTNHWMRAGNYGWQAADAGFIALCFTNTIPLMPAWGGTAAGPESRKRRLGNSPLVIAMPRPSGNHIVLDMALAQYSMGKLSLFQAAGTLAPHPAGFDLQGNLTHDPAPILAGGSSLPIGFWKGAGLSIMLDLLAASLSGGRASHQINAADNERAVSQLFLAINPASLGTPQEIEQTVAAIIAHITHDGASYPGARSLAARHESQQKGVEVDPALWTRILALQS